MSLVGAAVREVAANPSSSALPPGRATELQLAATALTRLAEHDECSAQIRACNGVTLLGKLLLVQPAKGDGGCGLAGACVLRTGCGRATEGRCWGSCCWCSWPKGTLG